MADGRRPLDSNAADRVELSTDAAQRTRDGLESSQASSLAVALNYRRGQHGPVVTAKGRGEAAERIVELALAAGVRVREDSDLAEVLSAVELDSEVPPEVLIAVAEILAYIYRANGQTPPEDPLDAGPPEES